MPKINIFNTAQKQSQEDRKVLLAGQEKLSLEHYFNLMDGQ